MEKKIQNFTSLTDNNKGNETIRVLITASGSANAINTIMGLRQVPQRIRIIGIDSNSQSAGLFLCDQGYIVHSIKDEELYIQAIYSIIEKEKINVVIPILSKEIPIFAKIKSQFEKKTGIRLALPSSDLISLLNDKYTFYEFLKEKGFPSPLTIPLNQILKGCPPNIKYPFVIKDRVGSGSRSVWFINNEEEFSTFLKKTDESEIRSNRFIVQEFIKGNEYTIDFCCDFQSKFVGAVIRERLEVRDGKCTKGRTIFNDIIYNQIKSMFNSISFIGPGNIQGILSSKGEFYFIEMNTRFAAGGLPLSINVGFNIPWIIVSMVLDPSIKFTEFNSYKTGRIMIRYYQEIFMDEDSIFFGPNSVKY